MYTYIHTYKFCCSSLFFTIFQFFFILTVGSSPLTPHFTGRSALRFPIVRGWLRGNYPAAPGGAAVPAGLPAALTHSPSAGEGGS